MNTSTPPLSNVLPALSRITGDEKHLPSAHSTMESLWALYTRVLNVTPRTIDAADRDRFLLSKGHGPQAYYAILAVLGFFPNEWLDTFGQFDSPLGFHPDRSTIPGVEISSGSLGHGLPTAVGIHRALDIRGLNSRVFVLLGDAELDEGSNWEAIALAGRLQLERLRVVVIDNRSSTHGWNGALAERFILEGWHAEEHDGRDVDALTKALDSNSKAPLAVIARTDS